MNKLFFCNGTAFCRHVSKCTTSRFRIPVEKVIPVAGRQELLSIAITTMFPTPKYCTNTTNREIW